MSDALDNLMSAVGDLVRATPALRDFVQWPDAPVRNPLAPLAVRCIPLIEGTSAPASTLTATVVDAVRAAASVAHWQQTYAEAEVGRDFLNRYGWFELLGPNGHFRSEAIRAFVAFWGEGLHYPMHLHEPEELYHVLAGAAEFHADGLPSILVGPGGSRHHDSNQPHAMDTHAEPVLTLVLWRGSGLSGNARIGKK
jgi:mannose-6-phosphate isomerase-like protein (cupin superfamily)|tara:strand:+ start:6308 stop:6895 length:588 start_codon:yes stop_codon:yes gene_type:complete